MILLTKFIYSLASIRGPLLLLSRGGIALLFFLTNVIMKYPKAASKATPAIDSKIISQRELELTLIVTPTSPKDESVQVI